MEFFSAFQLSCGAAHPTFPTHLLFTKHKKDLGSSLNVQFLPVRFGSETCQTSYNKPKQRKISMNIFCEVDQNIPYANKIKGREGFSRSRGIDFSTVWSFAWKGYEFITPEQIFFV